MDKISLWETICKDWGLRRETSLKAILLEFYGKPYLSQLSNDEFSDFKRRMHEHIFWKEEGGESRNGRRKERIG